MGEHKKENATLFSATFHGYIKILGIRYLDKYNKSSSRKRKIMRKSSEREYKRSFTKQGYDKQVMGEVPSSAFASDPTPHPKRLFHMR